MSSQLKIKKKTVYSITSLYYVVMSYNTDIPGLNSPNLFLIQSKKGEVELIIVFQKQAETHKKNYMSFGARWNTACQSELVGKVTMIISLKLTSSRKNMLITHSLSLP